MKNTISILILFLSCTVLAQTKIDSTLIFPVQVKHVHSSSIAELPNGDFLVCWFKGSGERGANDVFIEAAKDPKKRETGWMTRTHPIILPNGKILLPLYSDGFNFGLIAISEDQGATWKCSLPIVGRGLNQPSLVLRNDGSLDAFMRDDGDEPGKIMMSHSDDDGYSWTYAHKSEIPNPGASVEAIKLKSGNWLLAYNDADDGRYSLAVAISDDEGNTWKWKRNLENRKGGSFSYPSVIQAKNGMIHVTYSYVVSENQESIKHMVFDEKWVKNQ